MSADDHRALLRDTLRSFAARHGGRTRGRALRGTTPGFDRATWSELAEIGCIGALAPSSLGGVELALGDMAAMLQELGASLAPEPVIPVAVGAVGLLSLAPESALAKELLPAICEGRVIPSLAWQEDGDELPAAGSTAIANGKLDGRKRFVVPAAGDGWLVTALATPASSRVTAASPHVTPAKAQVCWIPRGTPGVTEKLEPLVDGTASATVTFEGVAVADIARIDIPPGALESVADACQVAIAAEALGVAESALAMTLEYLKVRHQFGKPLGSFQALQHRAVDLYVKQEMARAALGAAVEAWGTEGSGTGERRIAAARAKARATEAALAIGREAVQMHGAMGYADECDVGLHLKRALVLSAWLGNAGIQRGRVAGWVVAPKESVAARGDEGTPVTACDWDALTDEEFRLRVRAVFEREYPAALRNPPRRLRWHECRDFYFRLGQLGLAALAWPRQYGGAGLGPRKQLVFMQEQDRWGVARAPDMGITMVGPGLIQYGTPEQQRRYLPEILAWNHMWCQGFSEPDAGSDLASLRTKAVREGSGYVIDGAKIWTTFAQDATHIFMLARTDPAAKKQAGISMFLVDLRTPGITVRPIVDIAGHEEFCEVRFEGVRVPADALLGAENQGWTVAKTLLARERIYLGNPRQAQYALKRVDAMVERTGLAKDPVFMARLTALRMDVWDLASLYQRFADQVRRGEPLGPEVSILKLVGSETFQRLSELALEGLGAAGGLEGAIPVGGEDDDLMSLFMAARATTIYGGSNEVQRNVLAKQVLELPS